MKLLQQLRALFRPKNDPITVVPTDYSDEEFLNVMMEQARKRTQAEQASRATTPPKSSDSSTLSTAA